jgi:hypothetical protein
MIPSLAAGRCGGGAGAARGDRPVPGFEAGQLRERTCGYRVGKLEREIAGLEVGRTALEGECGDEPALIDAPSRSMADDPLD